MVAVETELLLLDLSSIVSEHEMDIVRMKVDGYEVKDIAQYRSSTVYHVRKILVGVQKAVLYVCCK